MIACMYGRVGFSSANEGRGGFLMFSAKELVGRTPLFAVFVVALAYYCLLLFWKEREKMDTDLMV